MNNKEIVQEYKDTVEIKEETLWNGHSDLIINQPEEVQDSIRLLQKIKVEPAELLKDEKGIFVGGHPTSSSMTEDIVKKEFKEEEVEPEFINYECEVPPLKDESEAGPNNKFKVEPKKRNLKKNYFCPICKKCYPLYKLKKNHLQEHFNKNLILCSCGKFFTGSVLFSMHYFVHYVKPCNNFLKLDKRYRGFNVHHNKHQQCTKTSTTDHSGNRTKESFTCTICLKQFSRKSSLTRHFRIHKGEPQYECKVCLKQYTRRENLINHSRIHTGEGRPYYECKICLKQFSRKDNLDSHSRTHTKEKPYKCEICLKGFSQKPHLTQHYRTHTGERPHECKICLKLFSQKRSLAAHSRVHTREKRYECEICMKQFSTKQTLTTHSRIHTGEKPYKCEICLKQFSAKQTLDNHSRIHNGDKPYKCEVCLKQFSRTGGLSDHYRIHTGEKPYKCEICLRQFSVKQSLNYHSRTHSRGEKP